MRKKNILLINDTSLICHHGCTLLMNLMCELFKKNNFLIKDRIFYEENYLSFSKNLNNYDLIVINGEGTIHGKKNSDSNKVYEIFEFIRSFKSQYDIPVVLINSTIASLKKHQLNTLRLVDKIYVRENFSYEYLKKNKIKSTILPDLLSILTLKGKTKSEKIIVNDSSIKKTTKMLINYSKSMNYEYVPILYNNYLRFIRFIIFKFCLKIKANFLINFYLYLKNLYLFKFIENTKKANFIITGRFHSIFVCLALMKPFYTFESDTYKIRGLINMIGINNRIIETNKLKKIRINQFSKLEILKIRQFKKNSKKKVKTFIKELKELVHNN
jgi:polysaccharide pyruvyl transferase WcaK-like protein